MPIKIKKIKKIGKRKMKLIIGNNINCYKYKKKINYAIKQTVRRKKY